MYLINILMVLVVNTSGFAVFTRMVISVSTLSPSNNQSNSQASTLTRLIFLPSSWSLTNSAFKTFDLSVLFLMNAASFLALFSSLTFWKIYCISLSLFKDFWVFCKSCLTSAFFFSTLKPNFLVTRSWEMILVLQAKTKSSLSSSHGTKSGYYID